MSERSEWPTPTVRDQESPAKLTRGANATAGGTPLVLAVLSSPLTCSSAVSPARTSPTPGSGRVSWPVRVPACGESLPDSLASYDPAQSVWKTSQGSLLEDSTSSSVIWPRSGMTRSGRLYALPTSARRIDGNGCSSWPTPVVTDAVGAVNRNLPGSKAHAGHSLTDVVTGGQAPRAWPTPRAEDSESSGARHSRGTTDTLTAMTRQWMTPQSRDWKGISQAPATKGTYTGGLPDQLAGLRDRANPNTPGSPPARSVVLNPAWVSCLMGFPEDWCDIGDVPLPRSATPSSRKSRKSSRGA